MKEGGAGQDNKRRKHPRSHARCTPRDDISGLGTEALLRPRLHNLLQREEQERSRRPKQQQRRIVPDTERTGSPSGTRIWSGWYKGSESRSIVNEAVGTFAESFRERDRISRKT